MQCLPSELDRLQLSQQGEITYPTYEINMVFVELCNLFWQVYAEYFVNEPPARAAFQVTALPKVNLC